MSKNRFFTMISWILMVIMVVCLMPIVAMAGGGVNPSNEVTERYTPTEYQILDEQAGSITNASSGKTVNVTPASNPNEPLKATISFTPTAGVETNDLVYYLGDLVPILPEGSNEVANTDDYVCTYDAETKCLVFTWKKESSNRNAFVLSIDCKPAYDIPSAWGTADPYDGRSFYVVAASDNAMMIPVQTSQSNGRNVLKSLSCSVVSDGLRNNDLEYAAQQWTFRHVSDAWYEIFATTVDGATKYLSFDNSNGVLLSTTSVSLKIEQAGDNQIKITNGNGKYLTSAGTNPANGFGNYNNGAKQEMKLYSALVTTPTKGWDGTTACIVNEQFKNLLTDTKKNSSSLKAVRYLPTEEGKIKVPGGTATEWTFENVTGDWYYIYSGNNYLTFDGNNLTVVGNKPNKPIFVRHLVNSQSDEFALTDSPYANSSATSIVGTSTGAKMNRDNVVAQKRNSGDKDQYHIYKVSNYNGDHKFRLMQSVASDDSIYLIYDSNGVNIDPPEVVEIPKDQAGTKVTLAGISGRDDFLGWSTVPGFYTRDQGVNNTTYHKLYRAGEESEEINSTTVLYAVWDNKTKKSIFNIRKDGIIQPEPNGYDRGYYIHLGEVQNAVREGHWVIDLVEDDEDIIGEQAYLNNDVLKNLENVPSLEMIQTGIENDDPDAYYDPETMYIHWYVLKYVDGSDNYWHVDGVIVNKTPVTVTITGDTLTKTYTSENYTIKGYDVKIVDDKNNELTEAAVGFDGPDKNSFTVTKQDVGNPKTDDGYKLGLEAKADEFKVTDPHYYLETLIIKDEGLTINPREVTLTAKGKSKMYDGTELTESGFDAVFDVADFKDPVNYSEIDSHVFTVTMTGDSKVTDVKTTPTANVIATVDGEPVTTGAENAKVIGNYKVTTADGELSVFKRPVVFTGESDELEYTGNEIKLTGIEITGVKDEASGEIIGGLLQGNNHNLVYLAKGTIVRKDPYIGEFTYKNDADDKVRITAADDTDVTNNYDIKVDPGALTIIKSTDSWTIAMDPEELPYNGKDQHMAGTPTTKEKGVTTFQYSADNGKNWTGSLSMIKAKNVEDDDRTILIRATNEYYENPAETTTTLKITPKHVDIILDTGKYKTYGDNDPTFTGDVQGLVNINDLGTVKYIRPSQGTDENAGTYKEALTATYTANKNYDVAIKKADFRIDRAQLNVTIDDNQKKIYGDRDPVLTASIRGLTNGDTEPAIRALLNLAITRETGEDVRDNNYTISSTGMKQLENYNVEYGTGIFKIERRPVTVTAVDKVKGYGEADPTLTATVDGLARGEGTDKISYTLSRTAGENIGEYPITPSGAAEQGNYAVAYETGTLTIVPENTVVVTITAHGDTFKYDGIEKDLSGYEVATNNSLYTEADFTFKGSSELKGKNAGTYRTNMQKSDFVNTNANFENVVFVVNNGTLNITPRSITLTSADGEKKYDSTALTNDTVTITGDGFVDGEGVNITVTGRQTAVGESENTFTYAMKSGTLAGNYEITTVYGKLKVTEAPATATGGTGNNAGTEEEEVTYHKLTITYQYEDGTVIKTFTHDYMSGTAYSVTSGKVDGYTPDVSVVKGTMGNNDVNVTVTYSETEYTLTVKYVSLANGTEVAKAVTMKLKAGDNYTVFTPAVEGYTAQADKVTGEMPDSNHTITVFMTPDGAELGEGLGGSTGKGGGYNGVELQDYGTPLGIADTILGGGEIIE